MQSIIFRSVLFLSCLFLSACGVKGSLYPAPKSPVVTESSPVLITVESSQQATSNMTNDIGDNKVHSRANQPAQKQNQDGE